MLQNTINILGLALLGLDPVAALMIVPLITNRIRKWKIAIFVFFFLFGTAFFGLLISIIGNDFLLKIKSLIPGDFSPWWMLVNIGIILIIVFWVFYKFFTRNKPKKQKKSKKIGENLLVLIFGGLLLAISSATDPTFYGVILNVSEIDNLYIVFLIYLIWISITQIPLILLYLSYVFNFHKKFLHKTRSIWQKYGENIMLFVYIVAILIAISLLADTIFYVLNGRYLF